jgi:hypothetical protein
LEQPTSLGDVTDKHDRAALPSLRTERGSDPVTGVGGATVVGPPSSDILEKLKGDTTNPAVAVPTLEEDGIDPGRTEVLAPNALPPRATPFEANATYDRAETAILTMTTGDAPVLAPPPSFVQDSPKSSISGTAVAAQPLAHAPEESPSSDDDGARQARTNRTLMAIAGVLFVVAAGIVILALARG